jgi:SAM-dependent methyltransferase
MAGARPWERVLARAILATRGIDKTYRLFDRLRSRAAVALAPAGVRELFNELAYGSSETYRPESPAFRRYLFPWEEAIIREYFPPPPASILVGGAGGGREALALIELGYDVVAFEPSPRLARALAEKTSERLRVYRSSYQDLPSLAPTAVHGATVDLGALGPFDASILGWGSFSHLYSRGERAHALRSFADVTHGPVVVSFLAFSGHGGQSEVFSVYIGFYRAITERELRSLADEAGLDVLLLSTDERDTNWPHAVLHPRRP